MPFLKTLVAVGSGTALTAALIAAAAAGPAQAAITPNPKPCAQMGGNVTILNTATPTCTLLYTSGGSSIKLPDPKPRIIYGVVNMVSAGVAPKTLTTPTGKTYQLNPTEGKRWLSVGPTRAAQTIVAGEIVNGRIGKTFPYLFITDDAITDRFAGKTFIGKTTNSKKSIKIWTRIDWSGGLSNDGGLGGKITNYKNNILNDGQCKPAMVKQHIEMVKDRFGDKGKVALSWKPGLYKGQDSILVLKTQTKASYSHSAPTALELAQRVWKPGKINFTLRNSDAGLAKIYVSSIQGGSTAKKCSLPKN